MFDGIIIMILEIGYILLSGLILSIAPHVLVYFYNSITKSIYLDNLDKLQNKTIDIAKEYNELVPLKPSSNQEITFTDVKIASKLQGKVDTQSLNITNFDESGITKQDLDDILSFNILMKVEEIRKLSMLIRSDLENQQSLENLKFQFKKYKEYLKVLLLNISEMNVQLDNAFSNQLDNKQKIDQMKNDPENQ